MKKYGLMTLMSVVLALSMVSCGKQEVEEVLRPVRFQQVSKAGSETERSFSGKAFAGSRSNLSFKVGGTISKRNVNVGDRVKKDDVIAELEATDYVIQEQETAASLAQAEAQQRNSRANYDRVKALYEKDSISKSDLDAARATHDSDKAALAAIGQKLDLAKLQTGYTKLLAPMDGIVGEVFVRENENVTSGQEIIRLESEGDIEVIVGIPESFISRVKTDTTASVTFVSLSNQVFKAKVSEVSYSTAGDATYPVTVILNNPSKDIRPGMVAEVLFKFTNGQKTASSIVVPSNSVASDNSGNFVFVVKKQSEGVATVHKKAVEAGTLTNQGFVIKSGLSDGDLVVTAGVSKLTDGMKVKYTE